MARPLPRTSPLMTGAGSWHPVSRLDPITRYGIVLQVFVLFTVSGGMLWYVGYNYEALTGNPITKLHPSTYLIFLLFAWRSFTFGNPINYVVEVANRRPAAMLMVLIATVALVSVILRQRPNMAGLVDTFIAPAILVLVLSEQDERLTRKLRVVLHLVMTANALLALFEFATHTLVFPYRFEGLTFATDMRSTALQGHPLANAMLTAAYLLALVSGAKTIPLPLKAAMIGLQLAAMVAFGGRTGIVIVIVLGSISIAHQAFTAVRRRRVNLVVAAAALIFLTLAPLAVAGLYTAGFFDQLIERFISDGGSANARVKMFALFEHFSLRDIIVGPDIPTLESARRITGLEWGIENPIIRMVLYQGAFFTLLITIGFVLLIREIIHRRAGSWLPLVGWLILLNSSESLASKTTITAKFAVIILCLYRETIRQPREGRYLEPGRIEPDRPVSRAAQ